MSIFQRFTAALLVAAWLCPGIASAEGSSFKDVAADDPLSPAIEYVKEKGLFKGYDDGTFRPNQALKRSEGVKILVASKLSAEEIATFTKRSYTDVPVDAWYRPYAEAAMLKLGIIDGPPKTTVFNGDKGLTKAQFLKMLLKSQGVDATGAYSEIQLPLSTDITDPSAWYYPYFRYALSASLIQVETDGMLKPDAAMTRGDVATLFYRYAMYLAGRRTQALLSEEESELVNILQLLEKKDLAQAEYASARALIAARGALQSKPSTAIVQAAVKTAESFRALVRAYHAGMDGKTQDVITLAKDAWNLAERARTLSPELKEMTDRVQAVAKTMADQAREIQKKAP